MATTPLTVAPPASPSLPPVAARPATRPVAHRRRLGRPLRHPSLPLGLVGFALLLGGWWLLVDVLAFGRFKALPGPTEVLGEWVSRQPVYGISLFTPVYYEHIVASVVRVLAAFTLSLALGIPLGIF